MIPATVSICLPATPSLRYLARTLESVRAQTFPHWELVVVEGTPTDEAESLVRQFAASVRQSVSYLHVTEPGGRAAIRNAGINSTSGEWIALLDCGDLWTPDHLQSALFCARRWKSDFVHAGAVDFDSDTGRELAIRVPSSVEVARFPYSLFSGHYTIHPSSVVLQRRLWRKVGGFDPEFAFGEDRDLWIRCARVGATITFTRAHTCLHRRDPRPRQVDAADLAQAMARVVERNLDWAELPVAFRRRQVARAWINAGRMVLRRNPGTALQCFRRALRHQFFNARTVAYVCAATALQLARRRAA